MIHQFKIHDHVTSQSGLTYIVLAVHDLDMCGSVAYSVRRLRGGKIYGATRKIAESALRLDPGVRPGTEFVYDPDKMFPCVGDPRRMTD